jgi:fatty-acid peroxygenase
MPAQDLTVSLRRVPARPRSGVVIPGVRPSTGARPIEPAAVDANPVEVP